MEFLIDKSHVLRDIADKYLNSKRLPGEVVRCIEAADAWVINGGEKDNEWWKPDIREDDREKRYQQWVKISDEKYNRIIDKINVCIAEGHGDKSEMYILKGYCQQRIHKFSEALQSYSEGIYIAPEAVLVNYWQAYINCIKQWKKRIDHFGVEECHGKGKSKKS